MLSTLKTDKHSAEAAMLSLQHSLDAVIRQKERAIEDIESRYTDNNIDGIIRRVSDTLMQNKTHLTDLALSDQDAFSKELNDLVKNSLLQEVQQRFQHIGSDIIHDFSIDLQTNLGNVADFDFGEAFISRLQHSAESLINKAQSSLHDLSKQTNDKLEKSEGRALYRVAATVLGLTTSVVAPVIEVVIIFLPDILSYFGKGIREQKARLAIEQQLSGEIIPQIKSKIRSMLPELLTRSIAELINSISAQFEQEIQQKKADIAQSVAEKAAHADQIDRQIQALNHSKECLTALANQYLFQQGA